MAIKTIPCGGFKYDDTTVEFVDGVMKAKGSGDSSETWMFVYETYYDEEQDEQISLLKLPANIDTLADKIVNSSVKANQISFKYFEHDNKEITEQDDYTIMYNTASEIIEQNIYMEDMGIRGYSIEIHSANVTVWWNSLTKIWEEQRASRNAQNEF